MTEYIRNRVGNVRPYINGPASLLKFLTIVFDAEELERNDFGHDSFQVELQIGDSVLVLEAGELPFEIEPWTNSIYVYVEDVDAVYKKAIELGCTNLSQPVVKPYQERQAGFKDSGGNTWWVATYITEL